MMITLMEYIELDQFFFFVVENFSVFFFFKGIIVSMNHLDSQNKIFELCLVKRRNSKRTSFTNLPIFRTYSFYIILICFKRLVGYNNLYNKKEKKRKWKWWMQGGGRKWIGDKRENIRLATFEYVIGAEGKT